MKKNQWLWAVAMACCGAAFIGCSDDGTAGGGHSSVCGNKVVESGEACDDGNTEDGDGCLGNCKLVESGYVCPPGGGECVPETVEGCGDGNLNEGEECDDGNTANGDGCSSVCKIEPEPVCGNGIKEKGEECDDGGTENGDGCSSNCKLETVSEPYCGDGIINVADEECDDGNEYRNDGCYNCKVEPGFKCVNNDCFMFGCGDGTVQPDNDEECDVGLAGRGDYGKTEDNVPLCRMTCKAEDKSDCCKNAHYCGDGNLDADYDEECDNGADNSQYAYGDDGCLKNCKKAPYCGDGIFQIGKESCDPKDPNSQGKCKNDCSGAVDGWSCDALTGKCEELPPAYVPACNNGTLDPGEECDNTSNAGCNDCRTVSGYKCVGSLKPCTECSKTNECMKINYGDGKLDKDGYEQCDDGNTKDGDGCSSKGVIEKGYACPTPGKPCVAAACGDGVRIDPEQCDDGNVKNGDGCSSLCRIESGASCSKLDKGAKSSCTAGKCGDGKVGYGEACDDGNTVAGDGCSEDCTAIEANHRCPKSGGICVYEKCGDGKVNAGISTNSGEECDDGNTNDGDGCSSFCRLEVGYAPTASGKPAKLTTCGNGKIDPGEECDDGNKTAADGCSPNCRIEAAFQCEGEPSVCHTVCGNGVVDAGEECDDGNLISGDGCSSSCKQEYGYTCRISSDPTPSTIELPVIYRDFIGIDKSGTAAGYADSAWVTRVTNKYSDTAAACGRAGTSLAKKTMTAGLGHPDFENFSGNLCLGIASDMLGDDGKPVPKAKPGDSCCGGLSHDACQKVFCDSMIAVGTYTDRATCNSKFDANGNTPIKLKVSSHLLCPASFETWWRTDRMSKEVRSTLLLTRNSSGEYVFDSNNPLTAKNVDGSAMSTYKGYFTPLVNAGFKDMMPVTVNGVSKSVNGSFTTEIHTTFKYDGNTATLTFTGDDDVFIYINHKLAVDLGGMHSRQLGTVTITPTNNFDVHKGGIYDIHMFQTERARSGSNFKLTLKGFINPATSTCASICGDGLIASDEDCDDKVSPNCKNCKYVGSTCGNGIKEGSEECDDGERNGTAASKCLKTCRLSKCGDGYLDPNSDEQCDDGANNADIGPKCTTKCTIPVCGDGILSSKSSEVCDEGPLNGTYGHCSADCRSFGEFCGDGILNGPEECDNGKDNNNGAYGGCNADCTRAAYCGDGIVNGPEYCDGTPGCTSSCTKPAA